MERKQIATYQNQLKLWTTKNGKAKTLHEILQSDKEDVFVYNDELKKKKR